VDGIGLVVLALSLIALGTWGQFRKRARARVTMSQAWRQEEMAKHEQRQRKGHTLW
jgi:hypothetical protein